MMTYKRRCRACHGAGCERCQGSGHVTARWPRYRQQELLKRERPKPIRWVFPLDEVRRLVGEVCTCAAAGSCSACVLLALLEKRGKGVRV